MFLCALVTVPFILVSGIGGVEDKENICGKWESLCQHIEERVSATPQGVIGSGYFFFNI